MPSTSSLSSFSSSTICSRPADVPISAIYYQRHIYDNYPPFQRAKVWSEKMKRSLIDTILRGMYIPPILIYNHIDPKQGNLYWVVDGQQRLTTIFEFLEDGFATASYKTKDEPQYSPLEPNRVYSRLSQQAKNIFDAYTLHFRILEGVDEAMLGVLFRRLQNQQPLLQSEKLWSYTSQTTKSALELLDHRFWSEIFTGRKDRKRDFQACLYLLFLEQYNGFANMTTPRLKDFASGTRDGYVDAQLLQTIRGRLDTIVHTFSGTNLQMMSEVVPVYQAALLLDDLGYGLKKSAQGCLTPWFGTVRQTASEHQKYSGKMSLFTQIMYSGFQRHFWLEQLPLITKAEGLLLLDKMRFFDQWDRVEIWNKQNGLCTVCGKPVKLNDAAHHTIEHASGGSTTPDNCQLVHKECHIMLHAKEVSKEESIQEK